MLNDQDPKYEIIILIALALFSAFGGFMGYIMRTIDARKKISWATAFINGGASGFVGLIVIFVCQESGLSIGWTGAIVGICGWIGAGATIAVLKNLLFKKFAIFDNTEPVRERAEDDNVTKPDQ